MSRPCIRGCTINGVHFATCADYGRTDGACKGCAPSDARDGVLLCDRCYTRLRRRLEVAPDLVAHLRSIADPLKAVRYDRESVSSSGPTAAPAPVSADLLDACADIMRTIYAGKLEPGAASDVAYHQALGAVGYLLDTFDILANDSEGVLEWWRLVMSHELPDQPEFWTITAALSRWPLEERKRWAKQPCPECGMRAVKITPPRHKHSRTWFDCSNCGWRKNETDDDGLWAAAFGQYADDYEEPKTTQEKEDAMAPNKITPRDINVEAALKAGVQYVVDHEDEVKAAGAAGQFAAFLVGAIPALAEEFALVGDQVAADVRRLYQHGDLIAGGARMTAATIRAAVQTSSVLDDLAAAQAEPKAAA